MDECNSLNSLEVTESGHFYVSAKSQKFM